MDYTMSSSLIKGKDEVKLIIKPTTNLEREFFLNIFRGNAVIETTPNGDEVCIIVKDREKEE